MSKVFLALVLGMLALVSGAMFLSTKDKANAVITVNDLDGDKERIRIGGKVSDKDIIYKVEPEFSLKFYVEDKLAPTKSVPVVYKGIKPDMFDVGREVLIDGDFKEGTLLASQLLTQCPSKYEPPE